MDKALWLEILPWAKYLPAEDFDDMLITMDAAAPFAMLEVQTELIARKRAVDEARDAAEDFVDLPQWAVSLSASEQHEFGEDMQRHAWSTPEDWRLMFNAWWAHAEGL